MTTSIFNYENNKWTKHQAGTLNDPAMAQLVLCFAGKPVLQSATVYPLLKQQFPVAEIAMCSTAGEIYYDTVLDNSLVAVAMHFDNTFIKTASVSVNDFKDSYAAALQLGSLLPKDNLVYIMIQSDGSLVNGSELVKGLRSATAGRVLVTGGLAGDGSNFTSTLVGLNGPATTGKITAIGFYGKRLKVTHGSQGGWDVFGLEKRITKSTHNVLFELENQNALDLYRRYLGSEAENLPGAALLFPLSVTLPGAAKPIVRTILSINENDKTMTFAGDVPVGSKVRFMKADFDKIITAAAIAAHQSMDKYNNPPDFALLTSCVGRKLILGSRTNEEVKAVINTFSTQTPVAGYYSYGEIAPFNEDIDCQLHNQTMTITSFYENVV